MTNVVEFIQPRIQSMIDNEGIYVWSNTEQPNGVHVVVSIQGKLFSTKLDGRIDPTCLTNHLIITGPFKP